MVITQKDLQECSVHLSSDELAVEIIDQTQLPNRQVLLTLNTTEELCDAIRRLAVRGAPAIGIFAGYGLYVLALQIETEDTAAFLAALDQKAEALVATRDRKSVV